MSGLWLMTGSKYDPAQANVPCQPGDQFAVHLGGQALGQRATVRTPPRW